MHITFLGTGPIKPIPRPRCQSAACLDAKKNNSKSKRSRSSIIIKNKNLNLLLDVSPDFLKQIKKNKIKKIDAALITHPHFDAYGGIKQLDNWLNSPIPIYCRMQTWQIIKKKFKSPNNLFWQEITPYKIFRIKSLPILPLPVYHSIINEEKFPTLAYKIKNLIYCSDVKKIPTKSLSYFKNIKTLILDAAMYFNRQIFSHLNTTDAINLGDKLKVKNLYLTQIGHSYPPHNQAVREIKKYISQNKIRLKVCLAYDGQKIKP